MPQSMVDRRPKFENQVLNRKTGLIRRDKRRGKRKFL